MVGALDPVGQLVKRGNWLAGLIVGACAGILFGVWPTLAFLILVAFLIPVAISPQRRSAAPGLFVGMASTWLGLVVAANAGCAAFDAAPNQECVAPDLTGWLVIATGLLAVGVAGSIAMLWRRRPEG